MSPERSLAPQPPPSQSQIIAKAATVIMLGNVASRLLGLVRETVISHLFGATGQVSAFRTASIVPTIIYDLLIGGMISAALVPVFSDYAHPQKRQEMDRLASSIFTIAALMLLIVVLVLEMGAPLVAWLLAGGLETSLQVETTQLLKIILPAIFFFGLSGVSTGLLYANNRFTYPAFGAAIFNLGIIAAAVAFAGRLSIEALALGIVLGAILQFAIQIPGLRGLRLTPSFSFHPAMRRIALLYAPVVISIMVSQIGIAMDYNLASRTGSESRAWMQAATYLIQFPLGLIATAISMAVLPSLTQFATTEQMERFRRTLAMGLRMALILVLPATAGLLVLGTPIIALLFEHGMFNSYDTARTAQALLFYLPGLPCAALDQILIFAFYARKDTKTPVVVGVISVLIYLAIALALIRPLGMIGLVIANSCQWASHVAIMLALSHSRLQAVRGQGLPGALVRALLASLSMALIVYATRGYLANLFPGTLLGKVTVVFGAGGAGFLAYAVIAAAFRSEETKLIASLLNKFRGASKA